MKLSIIFSALVLLLSGASAHACSFGALKSAMKEPLSELNRVEKKYTEVRSTDGGIWEIFFDAEGRTHTIVSHLFGEHFGITDRITFLSKEEFAIVSKKEEYRLVYDVENESITVDQTTVARETNTRFYYCGADIYTARPLRLVTEAKRKARAIDDRDFFFDAPELKAYLEKIRD